MNVSNVKPEDMRDGEPTCRDCGKPINDYHLSFVDGRPLCADCDPLVALAERFAAAVDPTTDLTITVHTAPPEDAKNPVY